jgi:DNA polymerase IIIc chi subunit
MAQKPLPTTHKSAFDPLQLQMLQHNLHLDTIKTLTPILSTTNEALRTKAELILISLLEPFHAPAQPATIGESSAN